MIELWPNAIQTKKIGPFVDGNQWSWFIDIFSICPSHGDRTKSFLMIYLYICDTFKTNIYFLWINYKRILGKKFTIYMEWNLFWSTINKLL